MESLSLRQNDVNCKSYKFRVNIQRFTKMHPGQSALFPHQNAERLYMKMREYTDRNGCCFKSIPFLAKALSCSDRSIQRWMGHLERMGILSITYRKAGQCSNHTNRFTLLTVEQFVLNGPILSPGGDTRVTVIQPLKIEKQTTAAAVAAPEVSARPIPERPKPDPVAEDSRRHFRELRYGFREAHKHPRTTESAGFGVHQPAPEDRTMTDDEVRALQSRLGIRPIGSRL